MDDQIGFEHEYYRDTRDGNRQRCRSLDYGDWEDFAERSARHDVQKLTHIKTRPLMYYSKGLAQASAMGAAFEQVAQEKLEELVRAVPGQLYTYTVTDVDGDRDFRTNILEWSGRVLHAEHGHRLYLKGPAKNGYLEVLDGTIVRMDGARFFTAGAIRKPPDTVTEAPPPCIFVVDGVEHKTPMASMTGLMIKTEIGVDAKYCLFHETEDSGDLLIKDGDLVDLRKLPKLYTAPPASFGRK